MALKGVLMDFFLKRDVSGEEEALWKKKNDDSLSADRKEQREVSVDRTVPFDEMISITIGLLILTTVFAHDGHRKNENHVNNNDVWKKNLFV